jgi:hypothetical protein
MSAREISEPTRDEYGADVHPAFGMIGASRVSSTPGAVLFDSDVRHGHYVVLKIARASRKRDLNRDWIHGELTPLIEVAMSEAQWASFVSSMNTAGVPCTITATMDDLRVDGLPYAPRLQESMHEVHEAAQTAFGKIVDALAAYEALPATPVRAKREAFDTLRARIRNATGTVDYAAKSLGEHTENVVQRARADVEAMVVQRAQQLGLTSEQLGTLELLPRQPSDDEVEMAATAALDVAGRLAAHHVSAGIIAGQEMTLCGLRVSDNAQPAAPDAPTCRVCEGLDV